MNYFPIIRNGKTFYNSLCFNWLRPTALLNHKAITLGCVRRRRLNITLGWGAVIGPKIGPMTAFWAVFAVMGPIDGPMTAVYHPGVAT